MALKRLPQLKKMMPYKTTRRSGSGGSSRASRAEAARVAELNKAVNEYNAAVEARDIAKVTSLGKTISAQKGADWAAQNAKKIADLKAQEQARIIAEMKAKRDAQIKKYVAPKPPVVPPQELVQRVSQWDKELQKKVEAQKQKARDEYNAKWDAYYGKMIEDPISYEDEITLGKPGRRAGPIVKKDTGFKKFTPEEIKKREVQEAMGKANDGGYDIVDVNTGESLTAKKPSQYEIVDVETGKKVSSSKSSGRGESTIVNLDKGTPVKDSGYEIVRESPPSVVTKKTGVIEYVEKSLIPALTLEETIYLPDKESQKEYDELLKRSKLIGFKGKLPTSTEVGLKGGELTKFLREQQAQLERDMISYRRLALATQNKLTSVEYRELEQKIKDETATPKDIARYQSLYESYEDSFNRAEELRKRIEGGYQGTGWQILDKKVDQLKATTGRDATLARSLLKGGVEAYKVEKKVLAAQVGGAVVSSALGSTAIGTSLLKTATPVLKVAGSKYIVVPSGVAIGISGGLSEYQKTQDIPYAIAAGVGRTGGFLGAIYGGRAITSLQKSTTLDAYKKDLTKLSGDSGKRKAIIVNENGKQRILVYENKQGGKLRSNSLTQYSVEKQGNRWIVKDGSGSLQITDNKGNVLKNQNYDLGGNVKQLSGKFWVKGKLANQLDTVSTTKGNINVQVDDKILKDKFFSINIDNKNLVTSYVESYTKGKGLGTPTVTDVKNVDGRAEFKFERKQNLIATGTTTVDGKPQFDLIERPTRVAFNPTTKTVGIKITPEQLNILGGIGDENLLSNYIQNRIPIQGKNYDTIIDDFGITRSSGSPITRNPNNILSVSGNENLQPVSSGRMQLINTQMDKQSVFFGGVGQQASSLALSSVSAPQLMKTPLITSGDLVTQNVGILGAYTSKQDTTQVNLQALELQPKLDITQPSSSSSITSSVTGPESRTRTDTTTNTKSSRDYSQPTPTPEPVSPTPTPPTPRPPRPPTKQKPSRPRIPYIPDIGTEKKKKVYQGFHAEYLPENSNKFKRINKTPQTKGSALATMAKKVDKFRTTVGRIVKAKPIVTKKTRGKSPIENTRDPYYRRNKHKFRTYGLKNGQKTPLPQNTFVERKKFRSDNPFEKMKRFSKSKRKFSI